MNEETIVSAAFLAAIAEGRQALTKAIGPGSDLKTLYLISQRKTADLLAASLPSGTLVATSNWQVEQVLRDAGHFVIQIETLLSPELITEADSFIQSVVRGWYFSGGKDFTQINGISLGNIHEYEMLHCQTYATEAFTATHGLAVFIKAVLQYRLLLEIVQPAKIFHDIEEPAPREAVTLVAGECSAPLLTLPSATAAPLNPKPLATATSSLRHHLARRKYKLMRALHHRRIGIRRCLVTDRRTCRKSSIFLIPYSCLTTTANLLKTRLHHVYLPDDLPPGMADSRTQAAHAALLTAWKNIKAQPDYQSRFFFFGFSCFPYFDEFLTRTVETDFMGTLHKAEALEKFFRRQRIQLVLVPFDEPNFARLCVRVAQRMEVPAIVCQHGIFDHAGHSHELRTAENVCVISEWDHDVLRQQRPDVPITIVGCLQLDTLTAKAQKPCETVQPTTRRLRILVLTFATDTFTAQCRSIDSEIYLDGIAQALRPFAAQVHVVFKLHPAENPERYEAALALIQPPFAYEVATGYRLPELLPTCDLVIAPVSTGVVEALFLCKPVLHFRVSTRSVPLPFDFSGTILTATNAAELTRLIKPAVNDYEKFYQNYDFDRPLQSFGPQDGQAAMRVIQVVESLIGAQRHEL